MTTQCSACGTKLGALRPEWRCPACGARFSADHDWGPPANLRILARAGEGAGERAGYRTAEPVRRLDLELRAFSWLYAPLVVLAILWDAIALMVCVVWLPFGLIAGVLLLLPFEALLVAGVLSYLGAVAVFERTRIRVDSGELSVHRGPLPWLKPVRLRVERVRDVCAQGDQARWLARWSLSAIQQDGHAVRLLHDASEREACYVARTLRAALASLTAARGEARELPGRSGNVQSPI